MHLSEIILSPGSHESRDDGVCAMEAVAWLAGEEHKTSPVCVAKGLVNIVMMINDCGTDEDRERLKRYLPALIGTAENWSEVECTDMVFATKTVVNSDIMTQSTGPKTATFKWAMRASGQCIVSEPRQREIIEILFNLLYTAVRPVADEKLEQMVLSE